MFYCSECESPVGTLTIASDGQAVCGLWLDGQKYHGATIPEKMVPDDDAAGFAELRAWLEAYFAGDPQPISDVPLAPRGSEFQQAVWKRLIAIHMANSRHTVQSRPNSSVNGARRLPLRLVARSDTTPSPS